MKVSVLIPAYNAESYIDQCLNSVLSQTLKDIEIIVIDDGSTDHTGYILDKFEKKYPQLKIIHQENKGLYKTRKELLSLAEGEYVGWVDADDFIEPTMYEKLYSVAIKNKSDLVYCNYSFYPQKPSTKEKWFRIYKGVRDINFIERNSQPWNKIVKKSVLEELMIGEMLENCFDECYIKILLEAKNPVCINENLYNYRISHASMSSSYKNVNHYIRFIRASVSLRKAMKYYWESSGYWKDYFDYRVIYYTILTMLVAANSGEKIKWKAAKDFLMQSHPSYHTNKHIHKILIKNYGYLKGIIIEWCIPVNYNIAHAICCVAFS